MFSPAVRSDARIKLALQGPSGSGKTMSALMLAVGLGAKKIAVVDTENGSAALYADKFKFDHAKIKAPYTIEKYLEKYEFAIKNGYDCIISDSISHAWAGEGGILEQKTAFDELGGNSFTNWSKFTPQQQKFMTWILNSDVDFIATMRSKTDYVMAENHKGKMAPKKVGLAAIQREGVEYEFTTVFDLAISHDVQVSKDRTGIFDGQIFKITPETGVLIRNWLNGAEVSLAPQEPEAEAAPVDDLESLRGEVASLCNMLVDQEQSALSLDWVINKAKTKSGLEKMKIKLNSVIEQQGG
jgi:hypothetical protein